MIVSCPACRTRYRYHEPVPESGAQAVCSGCEGLVPLVAVRQAYVVRAQVAAVPVGVPAGVPVGAAVGVAVGAEADPPAMDSGLGTADFGAVAAADAAEMALPGMAPDAADPHFDQSVDLSSLPLQADSSQAEPLDGLQLESVSPEQAQPEVQPRRAPSREKPAKAKKAGAGRRVLQLLAILVLAAAGAAAGEYATMVGWLGPIEIHSAVEPVRLGIIGGLLGILIAWIGIRWTTPKP